MELFSPQIKVTIGKYSFSKGIEIEINSSEDTYYDWAKIKFVKPFEQAVTISKKDKATIQLGYNGSFEFGFTGYATTDFISGNTENEVILKDGMLLFEAVTVNNTFVNTTPQEVIRYCAGLAGINKLQLDSTPYPSKACLPVIFQNGVGLIKSLGTYWGIKPKFFFQDDIFYWGSTAPQSKMYHFEYAKNIISLQKADGCWELVTVSVPMVKHSQQIQVTHPTISGSFTVSRIRITTKSNGFIRTIIYFK